MSEAHLEDKNKRKTKPRTESAPMVEEESKFKLRGFSLSADDRGSNSTKKSEDSKSFLVSPRKSLSSKFSRSSSNSQNASASVTSPRKSNSQKNLQPAVSPSKSSPNPATSPKNATSPFRHHPKSPRPSSDTASIPGNLEIHRHLQEYLQQKIDEQQHLLTVHLQQLQSQTRLLHYQQLRLQQLEKQQLSQLHQHPFSFTASSPSSFSSTSSAHTFTMSDYFQEGTCNLCSFSSEGRQSCCFPFFEEMEIDLEVWERETHLLQSSAFDHLPSKKKSHYEKIDTIDDDETQDEILEPKNHLQIQSEQNNNQGLPVLELNSNRMASQNEYRRDHDEDHEETENHNIAEDPSTSSPFSASSSSSPIPSRSPSDQPASSSPPSSSPMSTTTTTTTTTASISPNPDSSPIKSRKGQEGDRQLLQAHSGNKKVQSLIGTDLSKEKLKKSFGLSETTIDQQNKLVHQAQVDYSRSRHERLLEMKKILATGTVSPKALTILGHDPSQEKAFSTLGISDNRFFAPLPSSPVPRPFSPPPPPSATGSSSQQTISNNSFATQSNPSSRPSSYAHSPSTRSYLYSTHDLSSQSFYTRSISPPPSSSPTSISSLGILSERAAREVSEI